jgi:hypothetical protein
VAHVPEFDDHDVVGGPVAWSELDFRGLGSVSRPASYRIALRLSSNRSNAEMSAQSSHVCPCRGRLGLISRDRLHYGGRVVEENVRLGDSDKRHRRSNFSATHFDRWWLGTFLPKFI